MNNLLTSTFRPEHAFSVEKIHKHFNFLLSEKDQLLRSVAHDLRNPVAGIFALAELLLQGKELSAEQSEMLGMIRETADHSLKMIQELVAAEPIEPGYVIEKIDLNGVIRDSIRLVMPQASAKTQTLLVNFCAEQVLIRINPDQAARVVDNLIGNAIKFTPTGGEIAISTERMSEEIQLIVKDNGIGIPEELQPRLFEGAKSCRQKGTMGETSYGLGLSICKRIVESYGGTITFQSRPGKGTIFYVWFPL